MGFQRDASTMRRQRRISEFGEAEFLGASFHDAPQSARQRLAALPFRHTQSLWLFLMLLFLPSSE